MKLKMITIGIIGGSSIGTAVEALNSLGTATQSLSVGFSKLAEAGRSSAEALHTLTLSCSKLQHNTYPLTIEMIREMFWAWIKSFNPDHEPLHWARFKPQVLTTLCSKEHDYGEPTAHSRDGQCEGIWGSGSLLPSRYKSPGDTSRSRAVFKKTSKIKKMTKKRRVPGSYKLRYLIDGSSVHLIWAGPTACFIRVSAGKNTWVLVKDLYVTRPRVRTKFKTKRIRRK